MSNRVLVYLSGPITRGDRSHNVCQFMQAHELLMRAGYAVINPGLTGLLPWAWEIPHSEWIENDLPIVERVDMLVRLPGESLGADMECEHARKHGIPIWVVPSVARLRRDLAKDCELEESFACV